MSETCTIANKTATILVLNLPHAEVPAHATMGVVGVRGHVPQTGERPIRAIKRAISGSVTLLAKGSKKDGDKAVIHRSALFAPDVKAALAAKRIEIVPSKPDAEKAEAADTKPKKPAAGKDKE
jgi:hypothetical protein